MGTLRMPDSDRIVISSDSSSDGDLFPITRALSVPATGCSSSSSTTVKVSASHSLDQLVSMFTGHLSIDQVTAIYRASGDNFDASLNCLMEGPTLVSILDMLEDRSLTQQAIKVTVDLNDAWQDLIAHYKSPRIDLTKRVRVAVCDSPAVDAGGVRCQVYNTVYEEFLSKLFEGPQDTHRYRPICTAEVRSSGLLEVLGTMVAHSISMEGIGYPYLSPLCYWYIIGGEERALEYLSIDDVSAGVASVISKVFEKI